MIIKRSVVLSICLVLLSSRAYATSIPSIADPFPNAGSVYSGLDQSRKWMPQARKAEVKLEIPKERPKADITTIAVKGIAIEGQNIFDKEILNKVIKDKIKTKMSLKELDNIALELRRFFRRNGYFAAYAYVPEQNVVDGIIVIKVMPGIYGKVALDNKSDMRSERLEDFMKTITSGSYIQRRAMDRSLLIMNDLPGMKVEATLKPGSKSGEADVFFAASTLEKRGGAIFLDNYGNRYTGRNRMGVSYHINNPAELGDQLSFYYMKSNGELNNYDVRYEIPVGDYHRAGTIMGLSFTKMDYELGAPYDQYDAYGNAETWQLYTKTPLKRMLHNNLYLRTSIESRQLTDKIDRWLQDTQKASQVVRIGLEGDYRTNKTASTYKFTQSFGWMHMIKTDMSLSDMATLAKAMHTEMKANGGLAMATVPGEPAYIEDISYWIPDMTDLRAQMVTMQGATMNSKYRLAAERYEDEYTKLLQVPAEVEKTESGDKTVKIIKKPASKELQNAIKVAQDVDKKILGTKVDNSANEGGQEQGVQAVPKQASPVATADKEVRVQIINCSGKPEYTEKVVSFARNAGLAVVGTGSGEIIANTQVVSSSSAGPIISKLAGLPFRYALRIVSNPNAGVEGTIYIGEDFS